MTFDDMAFGHYFAPLESGPGYREETVTYKDSNNGNIETPLSVSNVQQGTTSGSTESSNSNSSGSVIPETEDFLDILLRDIKNVPTPFDYDLENWFGSSYDNNFVNNNNINTTAVTTDPNSNGLNALLSELDVCPSLNFHTELPSGIKTVAQAQAPQAISNEIHTTAKLAGANSNKIIKKSNNGNSTKTGPFICHYCDSTFRKRRYLTRHIKKHAIEKAYRCPFYRGDLPPRLRCHSSGGFSRRDTYKTHLRTRHLLYPEGVRPQDRSRSSGHCAQCGEFFPNVENWVELHVESGKCSGLPVNYVRQVKSERKPGKLKVIRTSNGKARFISTVESVVEPEVLQNKDALEVMAIVARETKRGDVLTKSGDDKFLMSWTESGEQGREY